MASTIAVTLFSTLSFGSFHVVKDTLVMLGNDVNELASSNKN